MRNNLPVTNNEVNELAVDGMEQTAQTCDNMRDMANGLDRISTQFRHAHG